MAVEAKNDHQKALEEQKIEVRNLVSDYMKFQSTIIDK